MINDFAFNGKGILKKDRSAARVQRVQRGRLTGLRPEGCGRLTAAGCVEGLYRKVLKMDRPLAGGFLSLTAFQAEGCGIALSGDEFYKPPAAVTSTSSIIIRITTVHPFATSWPSSPKGDARSVTGLAVCVICDTISSATYFLVSP